MSYENSCDWAVKLSQSLVRLFNRNLKFKFLRGSLMANSAAATAGHGRGKIAGLVLAILFSVIYGIFLSGALMTEHIQMGGGELTDDVANTAYAVGISGSIAALLTWWFQILVASRPILFRFVFAFLTLTVLFLVVGGALTLAHEYLPLPGKIGPTYQFSGAQDFYISHVQGINAFTSLFLSPLRLSILGLLPAGALYITMFGPRRD